MVLVKFASMYLPTKLSGGAAVTSKVSSGSGSDRACLAKERRREGGEKRKTRKREKTRQHLLGQGLGTEAEGDHSGTLKHRTPSPAPETPP